MESKIVVLSTEELDQIIRSAINKAVAEIERNKEQTGEVFKPFLNTDECAEYINVAKSYLYKLTSSMSIPHYKRAKKVFFKRSEIDEWVMQNRIKTKDEIDQEATNYIVTKKFRH